MRTRKRRYNPRPLFPPAKEGSSVCRRSRTLQKSVSMNSADLTLLACESPLREGGTAPTPASAACIKRSQSHTSLSPIACVSCAKSIEHRWLKTQNSRAFASTPVSRATSEIRLRGMCLRSCLRTTMFERAGGVVFVFTPYRLAGLQSRRQPIFPLPLWDGCELLSRHQTPLTVAKIPSPIMVLQHFKSTMPRSGYILANIRFPNSAARYKRSPC